MTSRPLEVRSAAPRPTSIFAAFLFVNLTSGCALTPHAFQLRRQERLYNQALANVTPGQTRADLNKLFPQTVEAKARSDFRPSGRPFASEGYRIDSDFYLMVDFDYQRFRRIPGPRPPQPRYIKAFGPEYVIWYPMRGTPRYPYGTPYYRIDPQKDDRILSLGTRVSRSDGDLIYITPMAKARYFHQ